MNYVPWVEGIYIAIYTVGWNSEFHAWQNKSSYVVQNLWLFIYIVPSRHISTSTFHIHCPIPPCLNFYCSYTLSHPTISQLLLFIYIIDDKLYSNDANIPIDFLKITILISPSAVTYLPFMAETRVMVKLCKNTTYKVFMGGQGTFSFKYID